MNSLVNMNEDTYKRLKACALGFLHISVGCIFMKQILPTKRSALKVVNLALSGFLQYEGGQNFLEAYRMIPTRMEAITTEMQEMDVPKTDK
ncbi:hypothetical protein CEXT_660811 [Caerostris extrusa]|uniref:Uncharacterized protein n=1 Tax=Caerostris extrusa TaxID=172846 RepID=A0AAV4SIQ1_CAEEX|nr:hypothetical protein CEXT_660811 [Caerostris extrusa]